MSGGLLCVVLRCAWSSILTDFYLGSTFTVRYILLHRSKESEYVFHPCSIIFQFEQSLRIIPNLIYLLTPLDVSRAPCTAVNELLWGSCVSVWAVNYLGVNSEIYKSTSRTMLYPLYNQLPLFSYLRSPWESCKVTSTGRTTNCRTHSPTDDVIRC